ncbi:hypothetical protein [Phytoactinopolyspora mesophila]|uniref:Oligosaccharide repeat unit polymerase n=1 Tax=Phytoactinopolyspora mesophila TaxID=2650750 RepID=A0A7K3M365_9ACTN|nr:hypothetical protein [Phytoactinopolyspora mesophila]NDL57650.1 hypothetical protein [Phytoactinopolyspora mesophila]
MAADLEHKHTDVHHDVSGDAHRSARRHQMLALVFAASAVALSLPAGYRTLDPREQLVLGALSATLLSLAALQVVIALPGNRASIARWRIGPWYLLWSTLTLGIAPLTWLVPQTGSASRIELTSVVTALAVFAVSLVPWTVGYCVGVPRTVAGAARRGYALLLRGTSPTVRGGSLPWVLYGIGTGARLLTVVLSGRLGYVGDIDGLVSSAGAFDHLLSLVATFTLFAIAAAAYRAFSARTRGCLVTLVVLLGIETVVGALAGGKQHFLLSLLAVLIPYGALRGRMPLRILLAGVIVFLWIAVPFNTAYREVVRSDESTLSPEAAVAAAPEIVADVTAADSFTDALTGSTIQMLNRVRMLDSVAIIVQKTPETIPYRSPVEFASAPLVGVIPRALWPDKPVLATGYEFSREYFGTPRDMYTSTGITPLGDLYRHGGIVTVVVGMVLLGMGARLFDTLFRPDADPRAICYLLVFLPLFLRSDIYTMITGIPSGIIVATVGARLICRRERTSGPQQ